MNHKSVLAVIAGLFGIGLLSLVLSSNIHVLFYPELFYIGLFAVLVISCIVFFKHEACMAAKNKRQSLLNVIDSNLYIGKRTARRPGKNLLLRVSIITLLGVFKRK